MKKYKVTIRDVNGISYDYNVKAESLHDAVFNARDCIAGWDDKSIKIKEVKK